MADPPRLLDRVREAIRTRHYSRRTEEAYVGWIRRFILHHNKKHPAATVATWTMLRAVKFLVGIDKVSSHAPPTWF